MQCGGAPLPLPLGAPPPSKTETGSTAARACRRRTRWEANAAAVTLFGALGAVAALLPVILTQGASLRRELDATRADVGEVRRDLHDVSDRVARIEGALTGRVGAVLGSAAAPALPVAAGATPARPDPGGRRRLQQFNHPTPARASRWRLP